MKKSTGWAGLLAGSDSALELVSRYRFKGRRIVLVLVSSPAKS